MVESHKFSSPDSIRKSLYALKGMASRVTIENLPTFLDDRVIAGKWVDGIDAVNSLRHRDIDTYSAFISGIGGACSAVEWFDALDAVLIRNSTDEELFYPILAAAIGAVTASFEIFDILEDGTPVVSDIVMLILSPTYRLIRTNAFNLGVRLTSAASTDRGKFVPGIRQVALGRPYLCPGSERALQHYNLNHDLSHIVYFGDVYHFGVPNGYDLVEILLLAEECVVLLISRSCGSFRGSKFHFESVMSLGQSRCASQRM